MSLRTAPPFMTVITGLVPVIHGLFGLSPGGSKSVDGRIKSGHDDRRA